MGSSFLKKRNEETESWFGGKNHHKQMKAGVSNGQASEKFVDDSKHNSEL